MGRPLGEQSASQVFTANEPWGLPILYKFPLITAIALFLLLRQLTPFSRPVRRPVHRRHELLLRHSILSASTNSSITTSPASSRPATPSSSSCITPYNPVPVVAPPQPSAPTQRVLRRRRR